MYDSSARLFMNVLDIDQVDVLNVDEEDIGACRDMLVPSLQEAIKRAW